MTTAGDNPSLDHAHFALLRGGEPAADFFAGSIFEAAAAPFEYVHQIQVGDVIDQGVFGAKAAIADWSGAAIADYSAAGWLASDPEASFDGGHFSWSQFARIGLSAPWGPRATVDGFLIDHFYY